MSIGLLVTLSVLAYLLIGLYIWSLTWDIPYHRLEYPLSKKIIAVTLFWSVAVIVMIFCPAKERNP